MLSYKYRITFLQQVKASIGLFGRRRDDLLREVMVIILFDMMFLVAVHGVLEQHVQPLESSLRQVDPTFDLKLGVRSRSACV